jgi:hypothetical protein
MKLPALSFQLSELTDPISRSAAGEATETSDFKNGAPEKTEVSKKKNQNFLFRFPSVAPLLRS